MFGEKKMQKKSPMLHHYFTTKACCAACIYCAAAAHWATKQCILKWRTLKKKYTSFCSSMCAQEAEPSSPSIAKNLCHMVTEVSAEFQRLQWFFIAWLEEINNFSVSLATVAAILLKVGQSGVPCLACKWRPQAFLAIFFSCGTFSLFLAGEIWRLLNFWPKWVLTSPNWWYTSSALEKNLGK